MYWNTEADFVETFISSAQPIFKIRKNNKIAVWREFKTGYGRPDIVFVEYNPSVIESRKANSVFTPLPNLAAYTISYLSGKPWVTEERLSRFLNCYGSTFYKVLNELTQRGLIERNNHLVKAKARSEIMAVHRLWVFEAKLNHWKDAVDQAERHLWFTKDSYILLPYKSGLLTESIKYECSKRGVGLAFFDLENGYQTILQPAQSGFLNSPLLWLINERLWEEKQNEHGSVCT
ncbi:hypothetical protein C0966_17870 (plasmid) [Bacillus methanolicus]|jgi:hypothetical protein|uniref:hypothetical protein n=1 Tax=Bacillus methanolicus TaxID=1471 RepID=UPI00238026A1|nr:hypothetical protein [Bacillus methanolicus]MDE3841125.1 hypothetical protein [Bacillus methanolicus]